MPFGGLPASLRLQVAYCNFQCQRVAWKDPHERLTYCSRWTLCNACKSETTCNSQLYGCYNVPWIDSTNRFWSFLQWMVHIQDCKQTDKSAVGIVRIHSFPFLSNTCMHSSHCHCYMILYCHIFPYIALKFRVHHVAVSRRTSLTAVCLSANPPKRRPLDLQWPTGRQVVPRSFQDPSWSWGWRASLQRLRRGWESTDGNGKMIRRSWEDGKARNEIIRMMIWKQLKRGYSFPFLMMQSLS